jgi:hypothetical protein
MNTFSIAFVVIICPHSLQQARSPLFKEAASRIFAINTMYYNNSFFNILKYYFNHQFHNEHRRTFSSISYELLSLIKEFIATYEIRSLSTIIRKGGSKDLK